MLVLNQQALEQQFERVVVMEQNEPPEAEGCICCTTASSRVLWKLPLGPSRLENTIESLLIQKGMGVNK